MARSSSLLAPFVPSSRLLFRLCPGVARSLRRGRGHDLGRIRWSRPRATSTWLADCRLGLAGVVFQVRSVRAFSTCDHAELSIRAPSSSRDCVLPDCALLRHRTLIHACLPIAHTNKYRPLLDSCKDRVPLDSVRVPSHDPDRHGPTSWTRELLFYASVRARGTPMT